MPEGSFAEAIVLCEDRAQSRFITRWLKLHCNVRNVRERLPERGRGAGEQYVRSEFAANVEAHRRRAHRAGVLLVTVIDSDVLETSERHRQLACVPPLQSNERIYVFIPKRNIETWIRHLSGRDANEQVTYKNSRDNGEITAAADAFLALVRGGPEPSLASLAEGVREARRIPREHRAR